MTQPAHLTRRFFLQTTAAGAAATVAGLPAMAATSVNFQLSWLHSVQFGGSYIAANRGYWADQGLDVSLTQGGPNAPVEPPVVSGSALVGISAADYTAAAVAQGAPFKIIAVAMQKNPFAIASLDSNPVNVPADLIGKRIGMAVANTPVLQAFCTLNNLDINQIEIVPTQYDPAPLVSGQVDCLLCWATDLPVAMTVQGVGNTTMLMGDFGYALHSQTYIATEETIANRRADLVALLRGEIKGWTDYLADTDAVAALTVDMFPDAGLDLETQKLQAKLQVPLMFPSPDGADSFGRFTEASVESNIETLALLGQDVPADLWDATLIEEAYS